jgi:hypothetical protein
VDQRRRPDRTSASPTTCCWSWRAGAGAGWPAR